MATAATQQKIEKALEILKVQDWYWFLADYERPAYGHACGSMRAFVELVASIGDKAIAKALRDLWTATYDYVHATMWSKNEEAKAGYENKKAKLMAVILPQQHAVAA